MDIVPPGDSARPVSLTITGLVFLLGLIAGCGDSTQRFVPSPDVAEQALKQALDAWKAGQPGGAVANTSPLVHVTDTNRKAQQILTGYTILGEVASSHGRMYMVELELANPKEKVKAEYLLVGIDPLWVFRREDYELLMHWDHHMPQLPPDNLPTKDEK